MVRLLIVGVLVLLCAGGCAQFNPRGNGFGDDTANWGEKFRPPTQPGTSTGFDTRAREIERNLGVR